MGWIPHEFCPNPYRTEFIPWDDLHLYMDKNNPPLPRLNFINFPGVLMGLKEGGFFLYLRAVSNG